ncbi:unnamed protein product [Echinostoma caproni]|uniref:RME-8_N domain-containing protein n=1 Tax=Echinostoma caproni TaxID=27848 RepID=A0A183B7Q9_9TREM|nr:unnamed protein product [Echinostoma caproni]
MGITTYNKDTLRVTNQWPYAEVYSVRPDPNVKSSQPQLQRLALIVVDNNRKRHELTFASEYRAEVLTDLLRFRDRFGERLKPSSRIAANKLGWSERVSSVLLSPTPISIDKIDSITGTVLKSYLYRDMECIDRVSLFDPHLTAFILSVTFTSCISDLLSLFYCHF